MTGIGILISGYSSLGHGLSAYHWRVIVSLAWFANLTHLSGLTFLRRYFQDHHKERNWRVGSMSILLLFLVPALIPTGFFNWSSTSQVSAANATSYAECFFHIKIASARFATALLQCRQNSTIISAVSNINECPKDTAELAFTTALQSMALSLMLLVFSFGTRVVKLSRSLSAFCSHNIRFKLSHAAKRRILNIHRVCPRYVSPELRSHMITKPTLAALLLLRLYADLCISMLSEVCRFICVARDTFFWAVNGS